MNHIGNFLGGECQHDLEQGESCRASSGVGGWERQLDFKLDE